MEPPSTELNAYVLSRHRRVELDLALKRLLVRILFDFHDARAAVALHRGA